MRVSANTVLCHSQTGGLCTFSLTFPQKMSYCLDFYVSAYVAKQNIQALLITVFQCFAALPLLHGHIVEEQSAWMKQRLIYSMGQHFLLSKVALLAENVELLKSAVQTFPTEYSQISKLPGNTYHIT